MPEFKKSVNEIPDSDWNPLYKIQAGKLVKTTTEWAEVALFQMR